jgi:hypothetical protein
VLTHVNKTLSQARAYRNQQRYPGNHRSAHWLQ